VEVLEGGVAADDDTGGSIPLQSSYRSKSCLEAAVVGLQQVLAWTSVSWEAAGYPRRRCGVSRLALTGALGGRGSARICAAVRCAAASAAFRRTSLPIPMCNGIIGFLGPGTDYKVKLGHILNLRAAGARLYGVDAVLSTGLSLCSLRRR